MPTLVRLYIRNVFVGFGLSALFVGALLGLNVANLWHLISTSPQGWLAVLMLFVFHGIVFAGVQFAIVIMRMEDRGQGSGGGRREAIKPAQAEPLRVRVAVGGLPRRH